MKLAGRVGCDFCKEGFGVCSSVPVHIAQELPRCQQDLIALSANTEELPLSLNLYKPSEKWLGIKCMSG